MQNNNHPANQFDFWLGEWDCSWGEDGKANNRVERILGGKIIQENFEGGNLLGISLSAWDAEIKQWRQTWVDNSGSYLDFSGDFRDGRMILSRDALMGGEAFKQRMVWYNIEADGFDWNWERSDDGGATWKVNWQIKYMRKKS